MNTLIATAFCLCIATTANGFLFSKIKTVDRLDVEKYTGRWYEVCLLEILPFFTVVCNVSEILSSSYERPSITPFSVRYLYT